MNRSTRTIPFEVKSAEDSGDGAICTFQGLANAYFNLDNYGDIADPGCFCADMPFTLKEGKVRNEHGETTGRIVGAAEVPEGLQIKGEVYATAAGKDQRILIKSNTITRLSIGYCTLARTWLESAEAVKAYWQTKGYTPDEDDLVNLGYFGGARLLQRVKVYEVSTVWFPANSKAGITSHKSGQHAGRSFSEESAQALATVGNLLERAEGIKALRAQKGRGLSPEIKSRLQALRAQLDRIDTLPEVKSDPSLEPPTNADADALFARFLALQSSALGVRV